MKEHPNKELRIYNMYYLLDILSQDGYITLINNNMDIAVPTTTNSNHANTTNTTTTNNNHANTTTTNNNNTNATTTAISTELQEYKEYHHIIHEWNHRSENE